MPLKYICDNCGAEEEARQDIDTGAYYMPFGWFQNTKEAGVLMACGNDCAVALDEKHGETILTKAEVEKRRQTHEQREAILAEEDGSNG